MTEPTAQVEVCIDVLDASDGGQSLLAIVQARDASLRSGRSIVLLHGMFTDRRVWVADGGVGLAPYLARCGHVVYVLQRRGLADSPPCSGRRGLNEQLQFDLPTLEAYVAARDPRPIFWLGHSFGAFVATRGVAETLDPARVAGLIVLACQYETRKTMLSWPGSLITRLGIRYFGRLPSRISGLGTVDEPPSAAFDACDWTTDARWKPDIAAALARIATPVFALSGTGDRVDPPAACRRFVQQMASRDITFMKAGITNGFAADYSHIGLITDRSARTDVWPRIVHWIEAQTLKAA